MLCYNSGCFEDDELSAPETAPATQDVQSDATSEETEYDTAESVQDTQDSDAGTEASSEEEETSAAEASDSAQDTEPTSETDAPGWFAESDFSALPDGVQTQILDTQIIQTGTVNGIDYSLTIDLSKWAQKTLPAQIVRCSELFWQCYPRMFDRFGQAGNSPTEVTLAIEDEGYEVASTSGNFVHLHDGWLCENPIDYDCLTHEFAHVIQNVWDGDELEYDSYIERFADYCRYVYAFDYGSYNDVCWTLQTVETESTRENSVRFLVWLDYTYSTPEKDIMLTYFDVCRNGAYPSYAWDEAWTEIFSGTALEGMDIDTVWEPYAASDFAELSSEVWGWEPSELLDAYDIRGTIG